MKSLIGKEWCDASSGEVIEVINPATLELIDTVPNLASDQVNMTIDIAYDSQKEWAKKELYDCCDILMKFISLVERDKENLAKLLSDETGKPIKEARVEIGNVRSLGSSYIERVKHNYGDLNSRGMEVGASNFVQYTVRQALGVCVVIIPFNFPSDIFVNKVISALLVGNAVVLKPSSSSPLTITKYAELLIEAGVLAGVISVVHGYGKVIGSALTSNKKVAKVSFCGKTNNGVDVLKNSVEYVRSDSCGFSGNDAFILCDDGDVDLAVLETVKGRLYNAGQISSVSKRFLIHNSVKSEYIDKLIEKIGTLKVGYPSEEDTDIGCLISEEAAIEVESQVNKTVEQGARIVYGGRRNGAFFEPTIIDGITRDMDVSSDMEILGPVISIIAFDTIEEAISIANQSICGIGGAVITRDINKALKVSEKLECSGVVVNGNSFCGSCEQRFGGWKSSGFGVDGMMTALDEVSRIKTVVLKIV